MTHVVLLEEGEVADDAHPHQQRGGAQQDATQVVGGHGLVTHTHHKTDVTTVLGHKLEINVILLRLLY